MNILFIGLGRIGLPQSLVFAEAGHQVYGYDADHYVVSQLSKGRPLFNEPSLPELLEKHLHNKFKPVSQWHDILPRLDVIIFTIGASIKHAQDYLKDNIEDLIDIKQIVDEIFSASQGPPSHVLLIFRTTLLIGSTDRIKDYIENKFGLVEGDDFFLSYVPERLSENNAIQEEQQLPKIISGYSSKSIQVASELFASVGGRQLIVGSTRTAEFCKLVDNSYRNTIFGFANELAMWASNCNVDVMEVINTVNTDYPRTHIPSPGFVSGYCLSKDPYIFDYGFPSKNAVRESMSLWHLGRRVNDWLVNYATERVISNCVNQGKKSSSLRVAILGLAFKADTDDFRMSHGFDLINRLLAEGVEAITVYDPFMERNRYTEIPDHYRRRGCTWISSLDSNQLSCVDAIIISTPHKEIKAMTPICLASLFSNANQYVYIFDAWNIWRGIVNEIDLTNRSRLIYEGLGMASHQVLPSA